MSSRLTVRTAEVENRNLVVANRFETVAGRIRLGIADRDSNSCRSIGAVHSGCRVLEESRLLMYSKARGRDRRNKQMTWSWLAGEQKGLQDRGFK